MALGWSAADVDHAAELLHDPGISVLTPALAAAQAGLVSAMHDPTEGGVITGLHELATAAGVGLAIDLEAIDLLPVAAELCATFGLNPLGVIASGALLATCAPDDAAALQQLWSSHGWTSRVIGTVTPVEAGLRASRAARRRVSPLCRRRNHQTVCLIRTHPGVDAAHRAKCTTHHVDYHSSYHHGG
ncbi:MAG: AIR synthase-related protein [Caldilineaceae bacterium]